MSRGVIPTFIAKFKEINLTLQIMVYFLQMKQFIINFFKKAWKL